MGSGHVDILPRAGSRRLMFGVRQSGGSSPLRIRPSIEGQYSGVADSRKTPGKKAGGAAGPIKDLTQSEGGRGLAPTGRNDDGGSMATFQGVVPMIAYEDGPAALDWLARAFGFFETTRMMTDGRLAHGEMETGYGTIMLATPSAHYRGPRRHRAECQAAERW